jgi:DNA-3-methyladenine glycosylase II
VQSATVFEALTWAIIGQQINLPFAISLRRTFIEQAGRPHSSGLLVLSGSADVARLDVDSLTTASSRARKPRPCCAWPAWRAEGALRSRRTTTPPQARRAAGDQGHRPLDRQLHAAARLRLCRLFAAWRRGDPHARWAPAGRRRTSRTWRAQAWLARYSPHRTMAAAHLWASLSQPSG